MKPFAKLFLCFLLMGSVADLWSQTPVGDKPATVTTEGVFNMAPTKSGYRINEYYVDLSDREVEIYSGKRVSVTGRLVIVAGLKPGSHEQGSAHERRFIREPKIKFLE